MVYLLLLSLFFSLLTLMSLLKMLDIKHLVGISLDH